MTGTTFLRYKSDVRAIVIILLSLLSIIAPFAVTLPLYAKLVWPALIYILSFSVCTINHNHMHHPIFYSHRLNFLFQIMLSIAKGHSSTTVVVPHNLNHHRWTCKDEDWISPSLAGTGPGIVRLLRYGFCASIEMAKQRRQASAPKLSKDKAFELQIERLATLLFVSLLCYLDPYIALFYVFIPWALAMFTLVCINLPQHDGCDYDSAYNHSRNFISPIGNWLCFNNGYHTIHHIKPGLHWSLLPEAHAKLVAPHIDPALVEDSIVKFVLRHYIISFNPVLKKGLSTS